MRCFFFCAFMLVTTPVVAEDLVVTHTPVEISPEENEFVKVLSVTELEADHDMFGGISALHKDGDAVLALVDEGALLRFSGNFRTVSYAPLLRADLKPLETEDERDAESLAVTSDGQMHVAFERTHRVELYERKGQLSSKEIQLPDALSGLEHNGGLEAIESLLDDRLVLIAESPGARTDHVPIWLQQGDGTWLEKQLPVSGDFMPTGLARLPDSNRMILLERSFSFTKGVGIRLSELNGETGERGAVLIRFDKKRTALDNFEGIYATHAKGGGYILTLISDDNFNLLQRTLLMKVLLKQ